RKKIDGADLSDSLLANPNLVAIGNTEKPMPEAPQGQPGMDNAPLDVQTGQTPVMEFPEGTPTDGSGGDQLAGGVDGGQEQSWDDGFNEAALRIQGIETKQVFADEEYQEKVERSSERWQDVIDHV